ncbi:MAG: hypothetical protein ACW98K_17395 [Candidatus Kariarchaeaceae archaeon]|jgi:hypothetical protein
MANEVVMYQSMFLLGIIMFGFFATSFDNYSERADDIVLEESLKRINDEVSKRIVDLITVGQSMKDKSDSFSLSLPLILDSVIVQEHYLLYFDTSIISGANIAHLNINVSSSDDLISSYSLGYENTSSLVFVESSYLISSAPQPKIHYTWDIISGLEIIEFQNQ